MGFYVFCVRGKTNRRNFQENKIKSLDDEDEQEQQGCGCGGERGDVEEEETKTRRKGIQIFRS